MNETLNETEQVVSGGLAISVSEAVYGGVLMEVKGHRIDGAVDPCIRFRMEIDQAENVAVMIQQFCEKLRTPRIVP